VAAGFSGVQAARVRAIIIMSAANLAPPNFTLTPLVDDFGRVNIYNKVAI
jgi:hypothetical protein